MELLGLIKPWEVFAGLMLQVSYSIKFLEDRLLVAGFCFELDIWVWAFELSLAY